MKMRLDVVLWVFLIVINNSRQAAIFKGTLEDAEEFGKFLEQTVDGDPASDDEYMSPNAWENSGKFEGDMVLEERQRKMLVDQVVEGISRNGLRDISKRWPDKTVVYQIDTDDFGPEYVNAITKGIEDIEANSCIKFREKTENDNDFVKIMGKRRGCFSKVGFIGGEQFINLQPRQPGLGCFKHGTVVHEMLHSLGFFHMQSDDKRDDYVEIAWDNIASGTQQNFRKYSADVITNFGVPYDYSSVLHYSEKAFSKNGQQTIIPKDASVAIGQRIGMSDGDIRKLNLMYNCDAGSNYKATTKVGSDENNANATSLRSNPDNAVIDNNRDSFASHEFSLSNICSENSSNPHFLLYPIFVIIPLFLPQLPWQNLGNSLMNTRYFSNPSMSSFERQISPQSDFPDTTTYEEYDSFHSAAPKSNYDYHDSFSDFYDNEPDSYDFSWF